MTFVKQTWTGVKFKDGKHAAGCCRDMMYIIHGGVDLLLLNHVRWVTSCRSGDGYSKQSVLGTTSIQLRIS